MERPTFCGNIWTFQTGSIDFILDAISLSFDQHTLLIAYIYDSLPSELIKHKCERCQTFFVSNLAAVYAGQ